jgi:hypothetical protein
MSLNEDIKPLTDNEIDNILRDIDIINKKGKDILFVSFFAPWFFLTLWKLLAYMEIIPGLQIELPGLFIFVFIFVFLILAYLLIALPFYVFGLFIIWKPIRKFLPSLPFYGCFTNKGCEQLKEKLNDMKYRRVVSRV